jgi:HAE1 family hydrophobic/amphiphilic exporter-1
MVDGRALSLNGLAAMPLAQAGGAALVGDVARLEEGPRAEESIARVDGERAMVMALSPGGRANLQELSRSIAKEQKKFEARGIAFTVIADEGREIAASFSNLLGAVWQGMLAVAAALFLSVGLSRSGLVAVCSVPCSLLASAALLAALGHNLDGSILSGLAVGLGATVDSTVLVSERMRGLVSANAKSRELLALLPALAGSSVSTLAVLPPLAGLDFAGEGIGSVALAIAAVTIVSLIASVVLLPPFLGDERRRSLYFSKSIAQRIVTIKSGSGLRLFGLRSGPFVPWLGCLARGKKRLAQLAARAARRALARGALLAMRHPLRIIAAALTLAFLGMLALAFAPVELGAEPEGGLISARFEAEPGASLVSVDSSLTRLAAGLRAIRGVKVVESTARVGGGSLAVSFDSGKIKRADLADLIQRQGANLGPCFIYLGREAGRGKTYEVTISGDSEQTCQDLARQAAALLGEEPRVREVVLNFKPGIPRLTLLPKRESLAGRGLSLSLAGESLRRAVHGPVSYKRVVDGRESDLRVFERRPGASLGAEAEREDFLSQPLRTNEGWVRAESLFTLSEDSDSGQIRRTDKRRVASLSISLDRSDARSAARLVSSGLSPLSLPSGYSWEFDRDALLAERRLSASLSSFIIALFLSYLFLSALTESFSEPLAILSPLPLSIATSALALRAFGLSFRPASLCAFVVMAGIAINSSILIVDEARARGAVGRGRKALSPGQAAVAWYRVFRARVPALAGTCGASIAGALPLAITGSGGLSGSLAFFSVWGVGASFFASLTVIPALGRLAPGLFGVLSLNKKGRV